MLKNGTYFLIKYLGLLFIIVSIYRCFIKEQREKELNNFNLPINFDYFIIIFEFICGIILLFFNNYVTITLQMLLLFLIIASVTIFINNYEKIMNEFNIVMTYHANSMSLVLHFTYIIIIIGILLNIT